MLCTGESMFLSGGTTLAMACKRTQLAWYRSAPRSAPRAAAPGTLAWLRKIFA
jgi:hypothetical protein